jgi:WD40 repeat protein
VGHGDAVHVVAVTPDDKLAISASDDHTMRVWDLSSGREADQLRSRHFLSRHFDWIFLPAISVAVTADGKRAISASDQRMLRVWDLASGNLLRLLWDYKSSIVAVAATPDGKLAISGSRNGTIQL